jgi:hypothetical protein
MTGVILFVLGMMCGALLLGLLLVWLEVYDFFRSQAR